MKNILLATLFLITAGCTITAQQSLSHSIPGWSTYTYKNVSLQHPPDWEVIFDSEVAGQPNGFALHAQQNQDDTMAPDEFALSTFNDREGTPTDYIPTPNKIFTPGAYEASYISFSIQGTTLYAGCGYYSNQKTTLDICNKILSTIRIQ